MAELVGPLYFSCTSGVVQSTTPDSLDRHALYGFIDVDVPPVALFSKTTKA
jgi:hypothetical protein